VTYQLAFTEGKFIDPGFSHKFLTALMEGWVM